MLTTSLTPWIKVVGLIAALCTLGEWTTSYTKTGVGPSALATRGMRPVRLTGAGGRILYVDRSEVTIADWQRCFDDGGCSNPPKQPAVASATDYPVTGVNWFDAAEYLTWISWRTGSALRLPTLAEWRELARETLPKDRAPLFDDPRLAWAAGYGIEQPVSALLQPSRSFSQSSDGIFDLDGNVWEWTADCAAAGFDGAHRNRCPAYYVGGAHIAAVSVFVRDPASGGCSSGVPPANLGLRLVSDRPIW